jgi:CRP/FNR family transcriptional regulator
MSEPELAFIRETKTGERVIPARADIMVKGDRGTGIYTLFSGWAVRFMELRDGCRQILDILLPGDLIGLQQEMTGRIRHSIKAITDVRVCNLDGGRFHKMFEAHPALGEALVATLLVEEHRADVRLLLLGRQRPTERLGYLLLESRERLQRRGEKVDDGYDLPLTYEHLADTIGVSRSQIGASLREMHARQWATLSERRLAFINPARMSAECEYSPLPDPVIRTLI